MMAEADLKPREPGKTLAEKKKKNQYDNIINKS
jgi:hypothetical protein